MFDNFSSKFSDDEEANGEQESLVIFPVQAKGLKEFFINHSGSSFNNGLYRVHSFKELNKWNQIVRDAFPEFSERIYCFGYDWLGRQFALDSERIELGEPLILMLEPGTGEVLEIPVNFFQFHEIELMEYANEVLAEDFFKEWLAVGGKPPKKTQCIGYKKPLFLNGSDTVENLEISNLEVYWDLLGQILKEVRDHPIGTPVNDINIEHK